MEMTIASLYTTILLLLLPLTLSVAQSATDETDFLSCLRENSVPDTIITTADATAYAGLLNSTVQNPRFIAADSTLIKPLLIVSPTEEPHVQHVVSCARKLNIRIRIRSGGHDYEGLSYVSYSSPFVLLDLANLRSISVDKTDGTAWVQAGAILGELYYAIGENAGPNLGFPAGTCPTLGIGGLFGGGGIGPMHRAHGVAADNIVDARLVNINGEIQDRKAMGEDVFWAIRGGGAGAFGVILSYQIKLVDVPTIVTVFNLDRTLAEGATKLVTQWQSVAPKLDERLFIRLMIFPVGEDGVDKTVNVRFQSLFLGPKNELLEVVEASFPELGLKEEDCTEVSWVNSTLFFSGYPEGSNLNALLQRGHDSLFTNFKMTSDFVTDPIAEEVWDEIFSKWFVGEKMSPWFVVEPLGGRMDEIPEDSIPFPHRKGYVYNIQYLHRWDLDAGAEVGEERVDICRKLYEFMGPYVSKNPRAAYVNYRDLDLGRNGDDGSSTYSEASVWGEKYFRSNFERLAQVKAKVDPENFFRNEQSVPPLLN